MIEKKNQIQGHWIDELEKKSFVYSVDCGHTFCSYCIGEWRKKKNNCPVCRTRIKAANPVKVGASFTIISTFLHQPSKSEPYFFYPFTSLPPSGIFFDLLRREIKKPLIMYCDRWTEPSVMQVLDEYSDKLYDQFVSEGGKQARASLKVFGQSFPRVDRPGFSQGNIPVLLTR